MHFQESAAFGNQGSLSRMHIASVVRTLRSACKRYFFQLQAEIM